MTDIPKKRALILHGTSAEPMSGWRPWLKRELEKIGYKVRLPELPQNDTPNYDTYNNFLLETDWNFKDSLIVGHSSGAVEILNLLNDDRMSKIGLGVMVSAWYGALKDETPEMKQQMSGIFPADGYDFAKIKSKADRLVFVHSDNDPYCPLEQAEYLSNELDATLKVLHTNYGGNADHLGSPLSELTELLEVINQD